MWRWKQWLEKHTIRCNCNGLLFISIATSSSLLGGAASGDTARSTLTIGRVDGQVDVFLGVSSHSEGWHVDQLLADANMALTDQDTGVMDGLGKVELEDLGLQTSLHEDLCGQLQDVIQRVLFVSQDTVSLQSADKRRGLEQTLRILQVKGQQSSSSLGNKIKSKYSKRKAHINKHIDETNDRKYKEMAVDQERGDNECEAYLADLGKHVLNTPDFTLAAKTVFTAELELLVQTFLLKRTTDSTVCLSVYIVVSTATKRVR